MAPMVPQRIVVSLVGSGVLERFPDLHFVLVEFNAHWLVATMAAMDKAWTLGVGQFRDWWAGTWDDDRPDDDQPGMAQLFRLNERWPYPLMPSEYVQRQIHVSFQEDPVADRVPARHRGLDARLGRRLPARRRNVPAHPRSDRVPVPRRRTRGPRRDPRRDARRVARRQGPGRDTTRTEHRRADVYYDPYDVDIDADPYPVYRRLREEAPLYYNERYDFFAVSRADDVERVLADHETFISGHGAFLDFIRADITMPPGMFIFEDPPSHTRHRKVLSRVFTPRRMAELEPQIRAYCARSLDPFVGAGRFDFVADLGAQVPMRTISMLLGIPESDQEEVRDQATGSMRTKPGEPMEIKRGRQPRDVRRVHRLARRASRPTTS